MESEKLYEEAVLFDYTLCFELGNANEGLERVNIHCVGNKKS